MSFTDAYMPKLTVLEVVSAVIISLATIADLIDRLSMAWSSRVMCINLNERQYLACATSELQPVTMATRCAVSPRLVVGFGSF